MQSMLRVFVGAMLVLVSHGLVCAQQAESPPSDISRNWWAVATYWDNDGSILKRNNLRDRHYTNGAAISFAHEPEWAHHIADWLELPGDDRIAAGYTAGQLMFTPEDITTPALVRNDRPYAGYLYAGVFWQHADAELTSVDHVQLDLGVVGPSSLAEETQEMVHRVISGDDPQGWDNQLRDEPTIQLTLRKKWRMLEGDIPLGDGAVMWDIIPAVGGHLGTVRREIEGSVMGRVGVNLPRDFGPGRIGDIRSFTHYAGEGRMRDGKVAVYLFGQAVGRAVEHNIFLEGNTWKSSHGVDAEPLVGELRVGLALQYATDRWRFDVGYSQTFMSDEFEGQGTGDAYGSLVISATRAF